MSGRSRHATPWRFAVHPSGCHPHLPQPESPSGNGCTIELARLTSFDRTLRWLRRRVLPVRQDWSLIDGVLTLRYEDLLADPLPTMARTLEHIGIAAPPEVIKRVVRDYTAADIQDGTIRS